MRKQTKVKNTKNYIGAMIIIAVFIVAVVSHGSSRAATVSELQAQKNALQAQINDGNQKAKELSAQADTLQNKLAGLSIQISQLQTQIELTKTKVAELQAKLEQAQTELDRQKALLKASLQALYKKGGASTVELLVGSDSFSQFINDQTYLERLKSGIQTSTEKVIALKQQIQAQKAEQQTLLNQQQSQQTSLQTTKSEQQSLLDQTKGQESSYQQMVSGLRAQQAQIMADIAAKMIASGTVLLPGDGSNGGYPTAWNNAAQDTIIDSWGMYNRECVSYTAFKVAQSGRRMPWWGYNGNATNWTDNANAQGIPVDRNPQIGDVAIAKFGYYGHAMYVEGVSGRTVFISQYNFDYRGHYSEMSISADNSSMGPLYFVHFP